jgi:hypothetical protein
MEVHQRTTSLGSDRGYDDTGSEVHEGRMQTTRREYHVVGGKAPSDFSSLEAVTGKTRLAEF